MRAASMPIVFRSWWFPPIEVALKSYRVAASRESSSRLRIAPAFAKQHGITGSAQCCRAVQTWPRLFFRRFALRNRRAEAADGLRLAGKADIGADRPLALGAARAVHAFIGPAGAIRRAFLHRDVLIRRGRARRDFEIGSKRSAGGEEGRRCDGDGQMKNRMSSPCAAGHRNRRQSTVNIRRCKLRCCEKLQDGQRPSAPATWPTSSSASI